MPVLRSRLTALDRYDDVMLRFALEDAFGIGGFRPESSPESLPDSRPAPVVLLLLAGGEVRYRPSAWFHGDPRRPHAEWAFALPTLEPGRLDVHAATAGPDARHFVLTVWRALRRVATNRLKSALDVGPVPVSACRGGGIWAGHNALERCRAAPRRLIAGAWGPCDDWSPPDTAWHRSARERAVAHIGRSGPAAPDDGAGVSRP